MLVLRCFDVESEAGERGYFGRVGRTPLMLTVSSRVPQARYVPIIIYILFIVKHGRIHWVILMLENSY